MGAAIGGLSKTSAQEADAAIGSQVLLPSKIVMEQGRSALCGWRPPDGQE